MSLLFCNQNKAQSQLRISGLFPSAYWFGQALVDVPMYSLILLLMYLLDYGLNFEDSAFVTVNQTIQVSDDIHRTNTVEWFHEKNWRCKWYLYCHQLNRCKTVLQHSFGSWCVSWIAFAFGWTSHSCWFQIPCSIGYAFSLIFLTYVISFIFRKGRKNSGIWSFSFFMVSIFLCTILSQYLKFALSRMIN